MTTTAEPCIFCGDEDRCCSCNDPCEECGMAVPPVHDRIPAVVALAQAKGTRLEPFGTVRTFKFGRLQ
jgi:hypothetical protein